MAENKTLLPSDPELDDTLNDELSWSPYESAPVSGDQRRSYRYPAQPGREVATVRRGRTTLKATLQEESAGGMAIEIAGKAKLAVDDEVEVGIYTGWYRARVIHICETEGGNRIGLQRISIISSNDDTSHRKKGAKQPGHVRNMVAVAFVAMAFGVLITSYFGGSQKREGNFGRRGIPANFADADVGLQGVLDGVNLLLEPHVAEGLKLSDPQQRSIEGVLIGASNSLGKAYEDSKDAPPEVWYHESQSIINGALENVLCSLTDEQIVKWRALMIHRRNSRDAI